MDTVEMFKDITMMRVDQMPLSHGMWYQWHWYSVWYQQFCELDIIILSTVFSHKMNRKATVIDIDLCNGEWGIVIRFSACNLTYSGKHWDCNKTDKWFKSGIDEQEYYTDIDRDGHEISRFGGLPRELYFPEVRSTEGKYNYI